MKLFEWFFLKLEFSSNGEDIINIQVIDAVIVNTKFFHVS